MTCKVYVHPIFLPCRTGWLQKVNQVSQSTMNGQIEHKFYSNIPYMTCKVHIHPVFLPCQPVDQVNYKKSTRSASRQWMGKLISIKHELLATDSIHTKEKQCLHAKINYTFPLLSSVPVVYWLAAELPTWHEWCTGRNPQKGVPGRILHLLVEHTTLLPETWGHFWSLGQSPSLICNKKRYDVFMMAQEYLSKNRYWNHQYLHEYCCN